MTNRSSFQVENIQLTCCFILAV